MGPSGVESALPEHPAVQEAATVGSTDRIRSRVVKGIYGPEQGLINRWNPWDGTSGIMCSGQLPGTNTRVRLNFLQKLPKTISGKIKRNEPRAAGLKKYSGMR